MFDLRELVPFPLDLGPSLYFDEVDGVVRGHEAGLLQGLAIMPMVVGTEPIFDAIRGG
jgi:hypothetical protein